LIILKISIKQQEIINYYLCAQNVIQKIKFILLRKSEIQSAAACVIRS